MLASVVLIEIAASFQVDTYVIGYCLALVSLGSILAIPLTGHLLEKISQKRMTLAALLLVTAGAGSLATSSSWPLFAAANFLFGCSNGMLLSIANHIIVHLYEAQARSVRLNLLNFAYSAGAVSAPFLGSFLVQRQWPWQGIYLLALLLPLAALFFTYNAPFYRLYRLKKSTSFPAAAPETYWNLRVYLAGIALFFYVVSETAFINWSVVYFRQHNGFNLADASRLLGVFLASMAAGRFLSGFIVRYIRLDWFILASSALSVAFFTGILIRNDYTLLLPLTALTGFCYSGLYASILSYGTLQLSRPSSQALTFFVVMTSLGGMVGQFLAGFIKQTLDVTFCLFFSLLMMAVVFLLILTARSGKAHE